MVYTKGWENELFPLSEAEASALLAAYQATKDGAYRTRLQAVRLYGIGYTAAQVNEITASPRSTLLDWCHTYRNGGIAALDDHRQGGNSRKVTAKQLDAIGRTLRLYTPRSRFGPQAATPDGLAWTVLDLKRLLSDEFGVVYQSVSPTTPSLLGLATATTNRLLRIGHATRQSSPSGKHSLKKTD